MQRRQGRSGQVTKAYGYGAEPQRRRDSGSEGRQGLRLWAKGARSANPRAAGLWAGGMDYVYLRQNIETLHGALLPARAVSKWRAFLAFSA